MVVSLAISCAHLGATGVGKLCFDENCESMYACEDICFYQEAPKGCFPKQVPGILVSASAVSTTSPSGDTLSASVYSITFAPYV